MISGRNLGLKMATRLAETCRLSLCNKITFINASEFVAVLITFIHAGTQFPFVLLIYTA